MKELKKQVVNIFRNYTKEIVEEIKNAESEGLDLSNILIAQADKFALLDEAFIECEERIGSQTTKNKKGWMR